MAANRPDRPILWRSRPLLIAAAMLTVGILLAHHVLPHRMWPWAAGLWLPTLIGILLVVTPPHRIVSLRRLAVSIATGSALVALGGLRMVTWQQQAAAPVTGIAAEVDRHEHPFPITVSGRVRGNPTRTDRRLSVHLDVDSLGYDRLVATSGRIAVTVWAESPGDNAVWPDLGTGYGIRVEGLLAPLPQRRNPADFDFGAYLRRRGVHAILSATGPHQLTVVDSRSTLAERSLTVARRHVRGALEANLHDDDARSILEALLLADRSGIDPTIRAGFARTGLAHLLAVSGLHVLLVGMVLYALLKPMLHRLGLAWRRVEVFRALITLILLSGYVSVVGGPASAVRALVMAAALIAGRAFERPANALNSLGGAALALLLVRPGALFDTGFQLSFSAVGALILLMPQLERVTPAVLRSTPVTDYVTRLVLASVAATLGTAPVLMANFGVFPLAGILLNAIAIPATGLALAAGLLTVLFHGWLAPLASVSGASADLFAGIVLSTGLLGERFLGWSTIDLFITNTLLLATLALAVLTMAFADRPRLRWRSLIACMACACLAVWVPITRGEHRQQLEVVFFDVGQGDATLVTMPNGRTLLVDAGPRDPYGDAGARVIAPHLRRFGVRRLDAVVITHPHSDHLGGLPSLLVQVPIGTIYDNGDEFDSDLYRETLAAARVAGVPLVPLTVGDVLDLDPRVLIHVLHPGPEPDAHANDASVVLRIAYGSTTLLLTGDVEVAAEATLTGRFRDALCSDLIKVPHHGSRTSSTEVFATSVTGCGRSRYAVVQVARRNRYGLPDPDAIARWAGGGAEVVKTATTGAVWMRSDGRSIERLPW